MKTASCGRLGRRGAGLGLVICAQRGAGSPAGTAKRGRKTFVRYSDDVEQSVAGEREIVDQILASMHRIFERHRGGNRFPAMKITVVPSSREQEALADSTVDRNDPNARRTATVGYL